MKSARSIIVFLRQDACFHLPTSSAMSVLQWQTTNSSLSHCPLAYPSGLPFSELKTSKTHRLSRRLSEGFMSLSALRKRPQKNSALPGFWLGDHIQLCSPSLPFAWIEDFSFPFRMSRLRAPPPTGLRGETADTELEGEPIRVCSNFLWIGWGSQEITFTCLSR